MAPHTLEFKDRMWTSNRSVLTQHGADLNPTGKHIVLDGRLKATPNPLRSFALFWAIERNEDDEQCNLFITYTKVQIHVETSLGAADTRQTIYKENYPDSQLPQVPILQNPRQIKKGSKLVATIDRDLSEVERKVKDQLNEEKNRKKGLHLVDATKKGTKESDDAAKPAEEDTSKKGAATEAGKGKSKRKAKKGAATEAGKEDENGDGEEKPTKMAKTGAATKAGKEDEKGDEEETHPKKIAKKGAATEECKDDEQGDEKEHPKKAASSKAASKKKVAS